MKLLKETWFWLMNISIILLLLLFVFLYSVIGRELFAYECFWVAIGSIGTLASVIVATFSIIQSERIRKQKDTYETFNRFKTRNFDLETKIKNISVNDIANDYQQTELQNRKEIDKYLCEIERIATCVNTNIFDVMVIYNMGGPFLIEIFNILYPIINQKRINANRKTIYIEFENMVKTLNKIQENYR